MRPRNQRIPHMMHFPPQPITIRSVNNKTEDETQEPEDSPHDTLPITTHHYKICSNEIRIILHLLAK